MSARQFVLKAPAAIFFIPKSPVQLWSLYHGHNCKKRPVTIKEGKGFVYWSSLPLCPTRPILSSVSTRTSTTPASFCASSERFCALSAEESPEIVSLSRRFLSSGCALNHSSRIETASRYG